MVFIRKSADPTPLVDAVFSVVAMAKKDKLENGDENVVDATIGSLYADDGKLVALHTVFDHYDAIDQRVKAAYAAGLKGNPSYREAVYEWVLAPSKADLCHSVIATPGGTGAISVAVTTFLGAGETLIIPDIQWWDLSLPTVLEQDLVSRWLRDSSMSFRMHSWNLQSSTDAPTSRYS